MDSIQLSRIRARPLHTSDGHDCTYQVDATLFLDLSAAGRLDDLTETVDYVQVVNRITTLLKQETATLLEAIASKVADAILLSHQVRSTRVCLTRLTNGTASSDDFQVSVTLERTRNESDPVSPASLVAAQERESAGGFRTADVISASSSDLQGEITHPSLKRTWDSPYQEAGQGHPIRSSDLVYTGLGIEPSKQKPSLEGGRVGQGNPPTTAHVVIAMGGCGDQAQQSMYVALASMEGLPGSQIIGISPLYSYSPFEEGERQPQLCAVAILQTAVRLQDLRLALRSIESIQETEKGETTVACAPLHLDIVEYRGTEEDSDDNFCLSASQALERVQVLVPWAVLEPEVELTGPQAGSVADLSGRASGRDLLSLLSENWILDGLS